MLRPKPLVYIGSSHSILQVRGTLIVVLDLVLPLDSTQTDLVPRV